MRFRRDVLTLKSWSSPYCPFRARCLLVSRLVDTSLDPAAMPRQASPAYVLGVGMTKFIKPRGKVDCKSSVTRHRRYADNSPHPKAW